MYLHWADKLLKMLIWWLVCELAMSHLSFMFLWLFKMLCVVTLEATQPFLFRGWWITCPFMLITGGFILRNLPWGPLSHYDPGTFWKELGKGMRKSSNDWNCVSGCNAHFSSYSTQPEAARGLLLGKATNFGPGLNLPEACGIVSPVPPPTGLHERTLESASLSPLSTPSLSLYFPNHPKCPLR